MSERPVTLPAFGGTPAERATMARGLALLFAAGATLVALTILLPHGHGVVDAGVWVAVGLGYVVAAGLYVTYRQISLPALHLALAAGSVLIAVCIWFGGDIAPAYPLLLLWVAIYAAYFFPPPQAAAHGVLAGAAYAVALWGSGHIHVPALHWLVAAGTLFVGGALIGRLTRAVREQAADLTAVAQMASRLGGPADMARGTCEAVMASVRADAAVLMAMPPGRETLEVIATCGSAEANALLTTDSARAALKLAVEQGAQQVVPAESARRPIAGLAHPVLRDGRPFGVLAVAWAWPRRTLSPRAEQAVVLYAAEAGVTLERAERLTREKERHALEINDNIVQGLVIAKYAATAGRVDESIRAIDDTLAAARRIVTDALQDVRPGGDVAPGDLIRDRPSSL